jgi:hypothetical protein
MHLRAAPAGQALIALILAGQVTDIAHVPRWGARLPGQLTLTAAHWLRCGALSAANGPADPAPPLPEPPVRRRQRDGRSRRDRCRPW